MGLEDRRATLEAAFDAAEEGLDHAEAVEKVSEPEKIEPIVESKTVLSPPEGGQKESEAGGPDKPLSNDSGIPQEPKIDDAPSTDKPPQSWKSPQKAKWGALDPDVRQEVLRRERETTQVLNDSAQARQVAQGFQQAIQPYMARIQSQRINPIQAVAQLLSADHTLSTAPKHQRAAFMAKLIQDYDIDIVALDAAITGKEPPDPVDSRVEQLLQQRLQPFQQFMQQQEAARLAAEQATGQELAQTVEQMTQDTVKYPHFEEVRETMADLIEIGVKRGQHISIETAYNRAVAMDPTISQELAARTAEQALKAKAAALNKRAQRAVNASVSVGGAPSGQISGTPNASDRRATIAAAFDAAGGR